jgi:hypothetical protein
MRPIDPIIERTATKISAALDGMIADLPKAVAPQMLLELVIRKLAHRQTWFMPLIMEDADIKEAYAAAVAETPATARLGDSPAA